MTPERLMEYIWEAINEALGTDYATVTPEAEKIYNCILEKLQKGGFNV